MIYLIAFVLTVMVLEAASRYFSMQHSPVHVRVVYSMFLLSRPKQIEYQVLNQRVHRSGFSTETELFQHYAKISGRSTEVIAEMNGRDGVGSIFKRSYSSGMHGVIEEQQKMHLGRVPKPNQRLNTLSIDESGRRRTGYDLLTPPKAGQKVCLVIGGSTAFGLGATSDENTIPGRLGHYLSHALGEEVVVVNAAYMGFTSYQELLALMQCETKPDMVVAISGWNDIDQRVTSDSKVSSLATSCDHASNMGNIRRLISDLVARSQLFRLIRRFVSAYRSYGSIDSETHHRHGEIYPMY